ncbi:MAG: hypothetical protein QOJ90_2674 [Actinomycetota bacterium]|jgi:uncharacterized protein (TIGR03085 family)|nr:hypothetical protein [Actinomycetota bacterium]
MPPLCRTERAALADLLDELGPDEPTLAEGWTTRDLAAHLVIRERRPDASAGIAVPFLAPYTRGVQAAAAKRPFEDLVAEVRSGPPAWSLFALPRMDRLLNTTEYFVHHEDVRRAQPGWAPRDLSDRASATLWKAATGRARLAFRGVGCGVVLSRPGADSVTVTSGEPTAVLTGEPQELLLYVFGRKDHALVEVTGPKDARACLGATSLDV